MKSQSQPLNPQAQLEQLARNCDGQKGLKKTLETIDALKQQGADLNKKMSTGETPGFMFIIKALEKSPQGLNNANPGLPPYPEQNFIMHLFSKGADPRIPNEDKEDVFSYVYNHMVIKGMLLQCLWEDFTGIDAIGAIDPTTLNDPTPSVISTTSTFQASMDPSKPITMAQLQNPALTLAPMVEDEPIASGPPSSKPDDPATPPPSSTPEKPSPASTPPPSPKIKLRRIFPPLRGKLNRHYLPFEYYMLPLQFHPDAESPAEAFNPEEYAFLYAMPDNGQFNKFRNQLLGSLQPFADIAKDFRDTLKPYKAIWHLLRDLLQPIRGIINLAKAAGTMVGVVLWFVLKTFFSIFSPSTFMRNLKKNSVLAASWLMDATATAIRGAVQLAFTPMNWFIRIPLRALATGLMGVPKIEDSQSINRFVALGEQELEHNNLSSLHTIITALDLKFTKKNTRGQTTQLDKAAITASYRQYCGNTTIDTARQYIQLFSQPVKTNKIAKEPKPGVMGLKPNG